jgi:hypothetical protein
MAQFLGEPLKVADLALDICQMVAGNGVDLLAISPDVPRESQENAHFLDVKPRSRERFTKARRFTSPRP